MGVFSRQRVDRGGLKSVFEWHVGWVAGPMLALSPRCSRSRLRKTTECVGWGCSGMVGGNVGRPDRRIRCSRFVCLRADAWLGAMLLWTSAMAFIRGWCMVG
ncbi:hypothetical protein KC351_g42 [Hortaea werneckii]|nr:hypothetical protein KC351_g42 [Hortaea werneckii]